MEEHGGGLAPPPLFWQGGLPPHFSAENKWINKKLINAAEAAWLGPPTSNYVPPSMLRPWVGCSICQGFAVVQFYFSSNRKFPPGALLLHRRSLAPPVVSQATELSANQRSLFPVVDLKTALVLSLAKCTCKNFFILMLYIAILV